MKKSFHSSVLNHRELAIKERVDAATKAEMAFLGESKIPTPPKKK